MHRNRRDRHAAARGHATAAAALALPLVAALLPGAAAAGDAAAADTGACRTADTSGAVAVIVCPADSTDTQWQAAGREACEDGSRCNAWIWRDAAVAPAVAPATDAELPKDRTAKAAAVWIADAESLLLIAPTK